MKRYIILLSLFVLQINSGHAQKNTAEILKNAYQKGFITKDKDSIYYQKVFFNAFPSDFQYFKKLYGYNDLTNKVYSYSLNGFGLDHINHFFALKCINEDTFIKKIIEISINAKDQADGIRFFQHNLILYVPLHCKEFIKILQTFSSNQIVYVWTFYFDYENHFDRKEEYDKILKLTSPAYKNMTPLITMGYQRAGKRHILPH